MTNWILVTFIGILVGGAVISLMSLALGEGAATYDIDTTENSQRLVDQSVAFAGNVTQTVDQDFYNGTAITTEESEASFFLKALTFGKGSADTVTVMAQTNIVFLSTTIGLPPFFVTTLIAIMLLALVFTVIGYITGRFS